MELLRRGNAEMAGGAELLEKQPVKGAKMTKISMPKMPKLPVFGRGRRRSSQEAPIIDNPPCIAILTFEENLQQGHLSQACEQLIQREEHLFGRETGKAEEETKESTEKLNQDYEALLSQVWLTVDSSLTAGEEGLARLKLAMGCVQQEELQDRRWTKESEGMAPAWRPRQCRQIHDARLKTVVEKQMDELEGVAGGESLSSLKRDICKMGKRVREDLLKVARDLQPCYPEEFDICNAYGRLYHQAFAERLMKITEFELDNDACGYLLYWVNHCYPDEISKHNELIEKINFDSLGDLLPAEITRNLEEQYISDKETDVKTWLSTALRKQEEAWLNGTLPDVTDGYSSSISIDVIQVIDRAAKEIRTAVSEPRKDRPIVRQLQCFLMSYMKCLDDFVKRKHENTAAVIKANLASLEQFENYIVQGDTFVGDLITRTSCLILVNTMKESGYQYLCESIQTQMKVWYQKLGTQSWLTNNSDVMGDLLEGLNGHIEKCKDLETSCFEVLMGQLHSNVMVEYVSRLFQRNLKIRERTQQEAAARLLYEDNMKLHALFIEQGSKEEWLDDILPKIAEVLKTQGLSSIQLDIVSLAHYCPDFSDRHCTELLRLKTNLSTSNIRMIKESLSENRDLVDPKNTRKFFSKVQIKRKIL